MENPIKEKDYFRLKGETAEKIVQELAHKTFLIDWCFLNPKLPNGKELCDLLVVFDDTAIIWGIKDLKLDENGFYNRKEVEKNLRQLTGARRQLFDLKTPIKLENSRRRVEQFDPSEIKNVHLISVLLGEGEDVFSFVEQYKNHAIHVFTKKFTEIALNELDTIRDFTDYLRSKEEFLTQDCKIILDNGEEDLLAHYLLDKRTFGKLDDADLVIIAEGMWSDVQSRPEYIAKNEANRFGYVWDSIINWAHTASMKYSNDALQYEIIARELARPNRFRRRGLGKLYFDAHVLAHNNSQDIFRRVLLDEGVTYCFHFQDDPEPRNIRKAMLYAFCFVARGLYKENPTVIGIATEKMIRPECSYDYMLFYRSEWTKEDQVKMEEIQKETGILTNLKMRKIHEDEYPKEHGLDS